MEKVFDSLHERQLKIEKSNRIFTLVLSIIIAAVLTVVILFTTVFYFVDVEGGSMQNTLQHGDGLIVNRKADVERGDVVIIERNTVKEQIVYLQNGKYELNKLNYPLEQVISVKKSLGNSFDYVGESIDYKINDGVLEVEGENGALHVAYQSKYQVIKRVIAIEGDSVKIENGKVHLKKAGESDYSELKEDYVKEQNVTSVEPGSKNEWIVGEGQIFYLGDNREHSEDSTEDGCCSINDVRGVVSQFSINIKRFTTFLFKLFGGKDSVN